MYIIKSCGTALSKNIELESFTSPKITNFRMAKRTSISLDKVPNDLDNYADHLLISYVEPSPVVDIYEKNGMFVKRINIQE